MKTKIVLGILITGSIAIGAYAQSNLTDQYSRSGKVDLYGFGEYLIGANTTTFSTEGVSARFGSGFGGGGGIGVNLSDHFNLNTEFGGAGVPIVGNAGGYSMAGSASILNLNINLDYNVLKTRFTPFVTFGAGLAIFNGDFGVPGSDFSETDFGFNAGVGVRWDINSRWFLKAAYHANWAGLQNSDNLTIFHCVSIAAGFKF